MTKFRTKALCFATISAPFNSDMMIGSVTIEYYDTANEEAFLHVPLMHPGSLQYGRHSIRRSKLFSMGIQYASFVASCAINVIERASDRSNLSRKTICLAALDDVDRVLESSNGQSFISNLEKAKSLFGPRPLYQARPVIAESCSAHVRKQIREMKKNGKRVDEIRAYCEANLAELQEQRELQEIDRVLTTRGAGLAEIFQKDEYQPSNHMIRPSYWQLQTLHEQILIQQAMPQRERALFAAIWRPIAEIDGMLIKPNPVKGKFVIGWICSNGTKTSLRLAAPMITVPRVENEMRTIAFTTEGIDILGPDGTPLRPRKGGAVLTASITKDQFLSTEAGQTLVELWQVVLRNKGMTIPSPFASQPY